MTASWPFRLFNISGAREELMEASDVDILGEVDLSIGFEFFPLAEERESLLGAAPSLLAGPGTTIIR